MAVKLFEKGASVIKDAFMQFYVDSPHQAISDTIIRSTLQKVEAEQAVQTPIKTLTDGDVSAEKEIKEVEISENDDQHEEIKPKQSDTTKHISTEPIRVDTPRTAVPLVRQNESNANSSVVESINTVAEEQETYIVPERVYIPITDTIAVVDTTSLSVTNVLDSITTSINVEEPRFAGHDLPIKLDRTDGIFALLLVSFLLLAHIYNGGLTFFKDNMMLVFSSSKSEKIERQTTTKEIFFSYFLVFLAVLLVSISIYEGLDRFMPLAEEQKMPFVTIGLFLVLMLLFIFLKLTFNRFIGYIFSFETKMAVWNQSYIVLLSMLGLLCFLPTLLLVYSELWHGLIIGFVLILFLIVQIILFIRLIIFFIGQKFNFLYLIAYLCTVEIIPYIFLGIGLVYLYQVNIFNTLQ